jgi:CRP-like cAMP-binding protein
MITTSTSILEVLPAEGRRMLLELGREVSFPAGEQLFREGQRADHFWVLSSGTVTLDVRVPGRRPATVETLRSGDLVGWSWLTPPYTWHMGAQTRSPVRALEFDARAVRAMCEENAELGWVLACRVVEIIGHRLHQTRGRLLDLYGPHGTSHE